MTATLNLDRRANIIIALRELRRTGVKSARQACKGSRTLIVARKDYRAAWATLAVLGYIR